MEKLSEFSICKFNRNNLVIETSTTKRLLSSGTLIAQYDKLKNEVKGYDFNINLSKTTKKFFDKWIATLPAPKITIL